MLVNSRCEEGSLITSTLAPVSLSRQHQEYFIESHMVTTLIKTNLVLPFKRCLNDTNCQYVQSKTCKLLVCI